MCRTAMRDYWSFRVLMLLYVRHECVTHSKKSGLLGNSSGFPYFQTMNSWCSIRERSLGSFGEFFPTCLSMQLSTSMVIILHLHHSWPSRGTIIAMLFCIVICGTSISSGFHILNPHFVFLHTATA